MTGSDNGKQKWHFSAIALLKNPDYSIPGISRQLSEFGGVESFQLSFARS